jgi:hypothetical protein
MIVLEHLNALLEVVSALPSGQRWRRLIIVILVGVRHTLSVTFAAMVIGIRLARVEIRCFHLSHSALL